MITNEIGTNAGKIWNLLNEQGNSSMKDLKKKLRLSDNDIYMAVGWLAREGKIFDFEDDDILMIGLKD
jgi:translation elongation factor EF-Ts